MISEVNRKIEELEAENEHLREQCDRLTEALIEANPEEAGSTWPRMTCPVCSAIIDWSEVEPEDVPVWHSCPRCETDFQSELVFRAWQAREALKD